MRADQRLSARSPSVSRGRLEQSRHSETRLASLFPAVWAAISWRGAWRARRRQFDWDNSRRERLRTIDQARDQSQANRKREREREREREKTAHTVFFHTSTFVRSPASSRLPIASSARRRFNDAIALLPRLSARVVDVFSAPSCAIHIKTRAHTRTHVQQRMVRLRDAEISTWFLHTEESLGMRIFIEDAMLCM